MAHPGCRIHSPYGSGSTVHQTDGAEAATWAKATL